jgi:hypothetical protein
MAQRSSALLCKDGETSAERHQSEPINRRCNEIGSDEVDLGAPRVGEVLGGETQAPSHRKHADQKIGDEAAVVAVRIRYVNLPQNDIAELRSVIFFVWSV